MLTACPFASICCSEVTVVTQVFVNWDHAGNWQIGPLVADDADQAALLFNRDGPSTWQLFKLGYEYLLCESHMSSALWRWLRVEFSLAFTMGYEIALDLSHPEECFFWLIILCSLVSLSPSLAANGSTGSTQKIRDFEGEDYATFVAGVIAPAL